MKVCDKWKQVKWQLMQPKAQQDQKSLTSFEHSLSMLVDRLPFYQSV